MRSVETPAKIINVPMDGSKLTKGGILFTDGLGSCVGAALVDISAARGWLGHFMDPLIDARKISIQVEKFVKGSLSPGEIRAFLRGAAPTFLDQDDMLAAQQSRETMINIFLKNGIGLNQMDIQWLKNPNHGANMKVNVTTGECTSRIYFVGEANGLFSSVGA